MKLLKKAGAIFDGTNSFLKMLAMALIVFVWWAVCAEVFMRYFLHNPLNWAVELAEYSLLYITFLGAAWLLKQEGHVVLDVVLNRLSPRNQAMLTVITSVLALISCLAITWWGVIATWNHFQMGSFDPRMLELPLAPLLGIIPVAGFLLSIQFVRRIFTHLEKWKAVPSKEQGS